MAEIKYQYGYLMDDNLFVRKGKDEDPFEYYDNKSKTWIPDWDLSEIHTGNVRYRPVSQEEAWTALDLQE